MLFYKFLFALLLLRVLIRREKEHQKFGSLLIHNSV